MAIARRGSLSAPRAFASTAATVTQVTGTAVGDVEVVHICGLSASGSITPPAGQGWVAAFTLVQNSTFQFHGCYYRVVASTSPNTYLFTVVSSTGCQIITTYTGVNNATPLTGTPTTYSSAGANVTAAAVPALTTADDNAWIITAALLRGNALTFGAITGTPTETVVISALPDSPEMEVADSNASVGVAGTYGGWSMAGNGSKTMSGNALALNPDVADLIPPTDPTSLTTTRIGTTDADLSWTASTDAVGVAGYELVVQPP